MRAILALSCSLTVARARTGASRRDGAGPAAATCLDVETAGCLGRSNTTTRPNETWAILQPEHCGTHTSYRYIRASLPVKRCLHSHSNPGTTSLGCDTARLTVILAANPYRRAISHASWQKAISGVRETYDEAGSKSKISGITVASTSRGGRVGRCPRGTPAASTRPPHADAATTPRGVNAPVGPTRRRRDRRADAATAPRRRVDTTKRYHDRSEADEIAAFRAFVAQGRISLKSIVAAFAPRPDWFVVRTNHLQADSDRLFDRLGFQRRAINATVRDHCVSSCNEKRVSLSSRDSFAFYDAATERAVFRRWADDFAFFGYSNSSRDMFL